MKAVVAKGTPQTGRVAIPSSKSLSHRALICASLAEGTSHISHPVVNKDTEATIACMKALGAKIEECGDERIVQGCDALSHDPCTVDCGESGSTLRFLIPVFAAGEKETKFVGHGRLMERPQTVYEEIFKKQGLVFEKEDGILKVKGPLRSGTYTVQGDISSQFISGLLFTLPLLEGDSTVEVKGEYESRSYVNLTLDALESSGIHITEEGNTYRIPGRQKYRPADCRVPGDDSQMAFFIALSLITNTVMEVTNMKHDSRQGDHVILDVIRRMGADYEETEDGYRILPAKLCACEVDMKDCPDLGPVLFALATQAEGTSVFKNTARLRIKESDRVACMEEELGKLGCSIYDKEDNVYVTGKTPVKGNVIVDGHNDHRIVMALAVLAAGSEEPVTIEGAEAVNKSYPEFFTDLARTGVDTVYD